MSTIRDVPEGYIPGFICTVSTCDVTIWGFVKYQPSLAGNLLLLTVLSILAILHIYLGFRYRTPSISTSMLLGLATEAIGYVGRILLHYDPFARTNFLIYLICLTIGPVFFAAAVYLCLGRIVVVYGEGISWLRPRTYTLLFVGCDVVSLVVQAAGGGISASAPLTNQEQIDLGTHILVAGLGFQVLSLTCFAIVAAEFGLRVWRNRQCLNLTYGDVYRSRRFKLFLCVLVLATVCIFIRSVFRVAELSDGFGGHLANNEVSFMVLDGAMVLIACIALTVVHPGAGFGKAAWAATSYPFFAKTSDVEGSSDGMEVEQMNETLGGEKA